MTPIKIKISWLVVLLYLTQNISALQDKQDRMVFNKKENETQTISIVVGRASDLDMGSRNIGPMAEGDEEEEGDAPSKPTNFEQCRGSNCCYQFTWPGYINPEQIPAPSNATCSYIRKERKDEGMACFDPLVYTSSETTVAGNGPNITALQTLAERDNWNIYCPLTKDKSCLTFKYYSRGGNNQIVNETRFCGSVMETISGGQITSGCYRQKVSGYIREVCACSKSFCNKGTLSAPAPQFIVTFITSILYFTLLN